MPKTFPNKGVYQSHLREQSPVVIKFTGDIQPSKFDDDRLVVPFKVRGDNTTYWLNIENDTIQSEVEATQQDQFVEVNATGNRDDARLNIESPNTGGADRGGSRAAQASADSYGRGSVVENYRAVLEAVRGLPGAVDAEGDLTPMGQDHAATVFIQWTRTDFMMPLVQEEEDDSIEGDSSPSSGADEQEDASTAQLDVVDEFVDKVPRWDGEAHDGSDLQEVKEKIDNLVENGGTVEQASNAIKWLKQEREHQDEGVVGEDELPF